MRPVIPQTRPGTDRGELRSLRQGVSRMGDATIALRDAPFQKSAVFLNIVQKAFDPPPFYLNICPILQGVFFKRVFAGGVF